MCFEVHIVIVIITMGINYNMSNMQCNEKWNSFLPAGGEPEQLTARITELFTLKNVENITLTSITKYTRQNVVTCSCYLTYLFLPNWIIKKKDLINKIIFKQTIK